MNRRVGAALHRRAQAVDAARIGPLGGQLLTAVAEAEPVSIHALVTTTCRDKSQITRAVQMLEAKGMLDRAPDPDDGRVSLLRLTTLGRVIARNIRRMTAEAVDEVLASLGPEDRERLAELLARL